MGVWSFLFNLDIHNIHKIKLCLLHISEEVLSVEDDLWPLLFPHVGSMHLLIQTALRLPQLRASSSSQAVVYPHQAVPVWSIHEPPASESFLQPWPGQHDPAVPQRPCRQPSQPLLPAQPAGGAAKPPRLQRIRERIHFQQPLQAVSDSEHPHTTLWATTLKAPFTSGPISGANARSSGAQDDPHRSTLITHTTVNLGLVSAGSEPSRPQPRLRLPQRWTHASIPPIAPGSPSVSRCSKTILKSPWRTPGWKPPRLNRWTQLTQVVRGRREQEKNACRLTHLQPRKIPLPTAAQRLRKGQFAGRGLLRLLHPRRPALRLYSCCLPPTIRLHDPKRRDRALRDSS